MKKLYTKKRKITNNKKESLIKELRKICFSSKTLIGFNFDDMKRDIADSEKVIYTKLKTDISGLQENIENKLKNFSVSEESKIIIGFYDKKRTLKDMQEIVNKINERYNPDEIIYYVKIVKNINKMLVIVVK